MMGKRTKSKRAAVARRSRSETIAKRKRKMYFIYAPVVYVGFLLTLSPYLIDLYRRPELGNGILMAVALASFPAVLCFAIRRELIT